MNAAAEMRPLLRKHRRLSRRNPRARILAVTSNSITKIRGGQQLRLMIQDTDNAIARRSRTSGI